MKKKRAANKTFQTDLACQACGEFNLQRTLHHVKSRAAGGGDESENLMPLCFTCHERIHRVGAKKFSEMHKSAEKWLVNNGWGLDLFAGKWIKENPSVQ